MGGVGSPLAGPCLALLSSPHEQHRAGLARASALSGPSSSPKLTSLKDSVAAGARGSPDPAGLAGPQPERKRISPAEDRTKRPVYTMAGRIEKRNLPGFRGCGCTPLSHAGDPRVLTWVTLLVFILSTFYKLEFFPSLLRMMKPTGAYTFRKLEKACQRQCKVPWAPNYSGGTTGAHWGKSLHCTRAKQKNV